MESLLSLYHGNEATLTPAWWALKRPVLNRLLNVHVEFSVLYDATSVLFLPAFILCGNVIFCFAVLGSIRLDHVTAFARKVLWWIENFSFGAAKLLPAMDLGEEFFSFWYDCMLISSCTSKPGWYLSLVWFDTYVLSIQACGLVLCTLHMPQFVEGSSRCTRF